MKKKIIVYLSMIVLLISTIMIEKKSAATGGEELYISEVVAANGSVADEDGEYSDWIELYYGGKESLDLTGYYLSDDQTDLYRWKFPQTVIEQDSCLVIFASGKNKITDSGELHTSFKLDAMGETIYFSDAKGNLISSLSVPKMPFDRSYGYSEKESEYLVFDAGSPKEKNNQEPYISVKETEDVEYSVAAGVYIEEIYLELSTKEKNAEIYYTLDGSIPDLDSEKYDDFYLTISDRSWEENKYTSIWTSPYDWGEWAQEKYSYNTNPQYKATVVKTRLYFPKEDVWSEKVWTNTYLIGANYTLPIVSLSVEEEDLFDKDTGIYVPGAAYEEYLATAEIIDPEPRKRIGNYSSDKKVAGYLEYFIEDGTKAMENDVTMRICGNISRGSGMKSLAVYAWGNEVEGQFSYPVFGEEWMDVKGNTIDQFTSLRLRNFGNDQSRSKFRDSLGQSLVKDLNFGIQGYQPAILLINGEYFGLCEIRENRDEQFFEKHFGIRKGNLEKVKIADIQNGPNTELEKEFVDLISYAETMDLSEDKHFAYMEERLDTEQFLDYVLVQLYLQNIDWLTNNCDFFRSAKPVEGSAYEDGKWRVILYDVDYSIHYQYENNYQRFFESEAYCSRLMKGLLKNDVYRHRFEERFEELMETNFETCHAIELQQQFEEQMAPEIPEAISRWDVYYSKKYREEQAAQGNFTEEFLKITPVDYWYEKMEELRIFFVERPEYARSYFYGLEY